MTAQKGKHGGLRANSGGARLGAGRPPRPPVATDTGDPTEFLTAVMTGAVNPSPAQLSAATTLAKLRASPVGGKKEQKNEAASAIATGRFAARPRPLKLVDG